MVNNLLLIAYPSQGKVLTSFRWATDYSPPGVYKGNAKLTQVSSAINATHYSVIFRCQNCLAWEQDGEASSAPTSVGFLVLGWCHATTSPSNGACPDTASVRRHSTEGIFGAVLNSAAANPLYSSWTAKATNTVTGTCAGGSPPPPPVVVTSVVTLPSVPRPTTTLTPSGCSKTYTVVAGDYCYLIATNNGLSLDQFRGINPGLNCDPLSIGVVVCVKRN
jgi:cellobiose dehydrogenase (acceptor)